MAYFKTINWNTIPIEQILANITISSYSREQVVPLDKKTQIEILKLLGVDLTQLDSFKIMVVYMPSKTQLSIHSDKAKETTDLNKLHRCIFLPLKSCKQLTWSWYEITDPSKIYFYGEPENWQTVPMIEKAYAKELDSICCDKPFLSDIGTFHALKNDGDGPAIGLSFRLMPWSWNSIEEDPLLPSVPGISLI
jgi:hypothetical protein